MSKVWKQFKNFLTDGDNYTKMFKNQSPGQRILPPRTATSDAQYQLRIDAGEVIDGKKNIYLQANSAPKNTALKEWVGKNGTHSNIATAQVDTTVPKDKQKEEYDRVIADIGGQFKRKIG